MKLVRNNLIAVFALFLIFVSLIVPTIMFVKLNEMNNVQASGRVTSSGEINLTVTDGNTCGDSVCGSSETSASCEADCGPAGGGGGPGPSAAGGGGGGIGPSRNVFDVNLDEEQSYLGLSPSKDDILRITIKGNIYSFEVETISTAEFRLDLDGEKFLILVNEIGKFDIDNDGFADFSVYFYSSVIDILRIEIREPIEEEGGVGFKKEKLIQPLGQQLQLNYGVILAIIIIVLITLMLIGYQSMKLKRIEKTGKKQVEKIYYKYRRTPKAKRDRTQVSSKLRRQKELLKKAKDLGYITNKTYSKSVNKINQIRKKL